VYKKMAADNDNNKQIQNDDEEKTADAAIKEERCAVPSEQFQDIARIASASRLTHCEVQTEAIRQYIEKQKRLSDCKSGILDIRSEDCKCLD
jgi:hypothetical protein